MLTVLLSAYACEPNRGSEPGVGWNWALNLSKLYKVIVLTRLNNKKLIEESGILATNKNLRFEYYDLPKRLTEWKKGEKGVHIYYFAWQYGALKVARNIVKLEKIDIILAVTFGNVWKPTFMYKLPCKFIWGPIGGGEEVPIELLTRLSTKQILIEHIRRFNKKVPLSNFWLYSISKKADAIIVRTNDSMMCIPKLYRDKCTLMIETGVDKIEANNLYATSSKPSESKDIVYIGRLVSLKFVDIGIRAFSKISHLYPDAMFRIVGDGDQFEILKSLVEKLNIKEQVVFHGQLNRDSALKVLRNSRALCMTSSKEGGAWVLFEAMMCGKPIVCIDTSGMKVVVNDSTGIKVPVQSYDMLIDSFAKAMSEILSNDDLSDQLGANGFERVIKELTWEAKIDMLNGIIYDITKEK